MEKPRPLVSAKKGTQKTTNYHKKPGDGEAHERARRKYDGGGQGARTWGNKSSWDRQGTGRRSRPSGGRSGSKNGVRRTKPRKGEPTGVESDATTSRAAKGGKPDGGRGNRNEITTQGCRGRQGPGEQVEGSKHQAQRREVEAGGSGPLTRWIGGPRL